MYAYLCNFRGRKIYEPPRYMTVNEAVRQLLDVIKTRDFKEESPGKLIEKPRNAVSKFRKKKKKKKTDQNI